VSLRRGIAPLILLVTLGSSLPALASTGDEVSMSHRLQGQMNLVARHQHDTSFVVTSTRCRRVAKRSYLCEVRTKEPATYGVQVQVSARGVASWHLVAQLS
jgi:hypothetical protein